MEYNRFGAKKHDMMRLWKETFDDTDEYIDLLFKSYYDDELFVARYDSGRLISQLCCIPYTFNILCNNVVSYNDSADVRTCQTMIKCGYLCGLATLPEYRKSGIMSSLISVSNMSSYNNGFIISFLIPASDTLRLYYNKFGYVDVSYFTNRVYSLRNICIDNLIVDYNYDKQLYYIDIDDNGYIVADINKCILEDDNIVCVSNETYELNNIYTYFNYAVKSIEGIVIRHSYYDFITILKESITNGGHVLFIKDKNNKPSGLLFCSNITEGEATVQLLVAESEESANVLLHILKSLLPDDANIMVHEYDGAVHKSSQHGLAGRHVPTHCQVSSKRAMSEANGIAARERKSFAMARILNVAEILKFVACAYPSSKFSILINRDVFSENEGFYEVHDAKVFFTPLSDMAATDVVAAEGRCSMERDCFRLTVPELSSILWRDISVSIDDDLAVIPRLPINVFLMLE